MNAQPLRGGELPITGGKQTAVWPLAEDEKITCDPGKGRRNVDDPEQAPMLASGFNSFLAGTKNDPRWGFEHSTAPILPAGRCSSPPPNRCGEKLCAGMSLPLRAAEPVPLTLMGLHCPRLRPEAGQRGRMWAGGTTEGRVTRNSAGVEPRDPFNQSGLMGIQGPPPSISPQRCCQIMPLPCSQTCNGSPLLPGSSVQGLYNMAHCL